MEAIVPLQVQEAAGFVQNAMTGEEAARIRQQHVQPDFSIRRCNFSNTSLCFDKHGNEKAGLWKTIQVRFNADRNYLVQLLPRTDGQGFFEMPGPYSRIRLRDENGVSLVHHPGIKHCGRALPQFYKAAQATIEENRDYARRTALLAGGAEVAMGGAAASGAIATAEVGGSAAVLATAGAALPPILGATVLIGGVAGVVLAARHFIINGPWIFKCDGEQEGQCRVAMEELVVPN